MPNSKNSFVNVKPSAPTTPKALDDNALFGESGVMHCVDCREPTTMVCEVCAETPICPLCAAESDVRTCPDCSLTPAQLADARARWGSRWWDGQGSGQKAA